MGSGQSIKVYHDRWIPRPSTFRVLSPACLPDNATVDSLKLDSRAWNSGLLRNCFMADDVDHILSIPPSDTSADDSLL